MLKTVGTSQKQPIRLGMAPDIGKTSLNDPIAQAIFMLWGVCFAVSALGIVLIILARRRARAR